MASLPAAMLSTLALAAAALLAAVPAASAQTVSQTAGRAVPCVIIPDGLDPSSYLTCLCPAAPFPSLTWQPDFATNCLQAGSPAVGNAVPCIDPDPARYITCLCPAAPFPGTTWLTDFASNCLQV